MSRARAKRGSASLRGIEGRHPTGSALLIGRPGVSLPADWWFATLLWSDDQEILVRQGGIAGINPQNQLHTVDMIRAIAAPADWQSLIAFKATASADVDQAIVKVHECEQALNDARHALWAGLARIGERLLP